MLPGAAGFDHWVKQNKLSDGFEAALRVTLPCEGHFLNPANLSGKYKKADLVAPKVKDMLGISSVIIVTFPVLCRRSRIVKRSKTHCLARGSTFMLTAFTLSEQK